MKPCSNRYDIGSTSHVGCHNHADLIHDGTVSRCVCERCPYAQASGGDFWKQTANLMVARQRRGEYKPTAQPCGGCGEPKVSVTAPVARQFISTVDWAVTVTTAPRQINYLPGVLHSLAAAGWSDPVVFAEPGSSVPAGVSTIQHETRQGCFRNWLYSARWALANTTAEQIIMVQDDTIVHPDSRQLAEEYLLWPPDAAFVSLYCPAHYAKDRVGVLQIKTKSLWGTCAMVWRRDVLQEVVDSPTIRHWRGLAPKRAKNETRQSHRNRVVAFYEDREQHPEKINNSDYVAGLAVVRASKRMYHVSPSPARHVAAVSTIKHGDNSGRRNCGLCADHSRPLIPQVFPQQDA